MVTLKHMKYSVNRLFCTRVNRTEFADVDYIEKNNTSNVHFDIRNNFKHRKPEKEINFRLYIWLSVVVLLTVLWVS